MRNKILDRIKFVYTAIDKDTKNAQFDAGYKLAAQNGIDFLSELLTDLSIKLEKRVEDIEICETDLDNRVNQLRGLVGRLNRELDDATTAIDDHKTRIDRLETP